MPEERYSPAYGIASSCECKFSVSATQEMNATDNESRRDGDYDSHYNSFVIELEKLMNPPIIPSSYANSTSEQGGYIELT